MGKLWATMAEVEKMGDYLLVRGATFANLINLFACGQMIDSLFRARRHHGAARIVYITRGRGFTRCLVLYNSAFHGLSKGKGYMRAYQPFKEGIGFGYLLSEPTYKVLVEGLCKEIDIDKAKDVAEFILAVVDGVDRSKFLTFF